MRIFDEYDCSPMQKIGGVCRAYLGKELGQRNGSNHSEQEEILRQEGFCFVPDGWSRWGRWSRWGGGVAPPYDHPKRGITQQAFAVKQGPRRRVGRSKRKGERGRRFGISLSRHARPRRRRTANIYRKTGEDIPLHTPMDDGEGIRRDRKRRWNQEECYCY